MLNWSDGKALAITTQVMYKLDDVKVFFWV